MSPIENKAETTQPDSWSHIRETVNMLYLAICQIDATLTDSNHSVETLTNSFTNLASHTQAVANQVQALDQPEQLETFKQDISATAAELHTNINASVQAFQFYDRICQRLDHVTASLGKVSGILESSDDVENPDAWRAVQEQIKSSYTMEAEHLMFEFLMRGGSVKEALEIYKHRFAEEQKNKDQQDDEIELF